MISVRKVVCCCCRGSETLAGRRRALTVRVPSAPRTEVTEVGSTSSGSWHLWVKVFTMVPSAASCNKRRVWGQSPVGWIGRLVALGPLPHAPEPSGPGAP